MLKEIQLNPMPILQTMKGIGCWFVLSIQIGQLIHFKRFSSGGKMEIRLRERRLRICGTAVSMVMSFLHTMLQDLPVMINMKSISKKEIHWNLMSR